MLKPAAAYFGLVFDAGVILAAAMPAIVSRWRTTETG
jgi:hypothetical protein